MRPLSLLSPVLAFTFAMFALEITRQFLTRRIRIHYAPPRRMWLLQHVVQWEQICLKTALGYVLLLAAAAAAIGEIEGILVVSGGA